MDLLMLSAGILDVLEALPYTRATFGTCVGSSLCQCNLHLSADYVDQEPGCIMHQCCFLMTTAMPNAPSPEISKDEVKKKNWDCQLCICNCTDPRSMRLAGKEP
ncbi:hypothetical protein VPH35_027068 [Triticum aestivum]